MERNFVKFDAKRNSSSCWTRLTEKNFFKSRKKVVEIFNSLLSFSRENSNFHFSLVEENWNCRKRGDDNSYDLLRRTNITQRKYLGTSDIGSSDIIRINKNSYPLSFFFFNFPFLFFFFPFYFLDSRVTREEGESRYSSFSVGNTKHTRRINARQVTSLFNPHRSGFHQPVLQPSKQKYCATHAREGCPVSLGGFSAIPV